MQAGNSPQYLSTVMAASVLAVSVSTVKRWVDEGVLPAHRTAGGHRKLLRAEVLALARQGDLPRGNLTMVHAPSETDGAVDFEIAAMDLWRTLRDGDGKIARAIVRSAYESGVAIENIADELIAPAMKKLGHDWETSRIDVWQEHRGTQICVAALYDLKEDLEARAEKSRPVAVGGAPEGDPYLLPTLLAQYVMLDAGWEAINLGPNTPLASLARAVRELRPRLLWLSVSYLENSKTFLEGYKDLYRMAERHGVAVVAGGQALQESLRSVIPYTSYGDRLSHLAAFARTLHPRPTRPQRGRPTKN
jgi:excisionase family DNA binding protein